MPGVAGAEGKQTESGQSLRFRLTLSTEAEQAIADLGLETPITGRAYVIVSRTEEREPRLQTSLTGVPLWGVDVSGLGGGDYASSPTFVLISEYTARLTLYHVDLYRISKPEDTFELGLDEILDGDGLCVVEWAERALEQFPAERLTVELLRTGDETCTVQALPSTTQAVEYTPPPPRWHTHTFVTFSRAHFATRFIIFALPAS